MSSENTVIAIAFIRTLLNSPNSFDYVSQVKKYPKTDGSLFKKTEVLKILKQNRTTLKSPTGIDSLEKNLRVKPIRTLSGVTPLTVLTKPYPCPGECIFCPSDIRMPKSYLSREPGAQRASTNAFDPYLQVYSRLEAYRDMSHPCQKAELIILGGTWSVYPLSYQIWFIKRLFDALNDFSKHFDTRKNIKPLLKSKIPDLVSPLSNSAQFVSPPKGKSYNQAVKDLYGIMPEKAESASWADLEKSHLDNETALVRCVGLVVETRPDYVTVSEIQNLRRFGATKIQLGIQSLNERVLKLNHRGHTVSQSAQAINLLRSAGFKIHLHWMPNLYGSTPQKDMADFKKMFSNSAFRPDELKIYPCSLIAGTALMTKYQKGEWRPYTHEELLEVLEFCLTYTPRYCRIARMVRDIGSHDIVTGNKFTNFRQIAENSVKANEMKMSDIRAREIRNLKINPESLSLKITRYLTPISSEYFLEYVTQLDQIAAFLRLSLPSQPINLSTDELNHSALIREVHVYGQALDLNSLSHGKAQHAGLGKNLIDVAKKISQQHHFNKISVISAVGTREYYRKLGFYDGPLYQHQDLGRR